MKKYYANIIDLSEIPEPVLQLAMSDWFDKTDITTGDKRIDDIWVRIREETEETIEARVAFLKHATKVRNGGGVRIKEMVKDE